MSAYLTWAIIGRLPRKRNGTDEVIVTIRSIAMPDDAAAEWILRERYPSATLVGVKSHAAARYPRAVTVKDLSNTPLRRAI